MQRQQWIMQAAFVGLAAGVISTAALVLWDSWEPLSTMKKALLSGAKTPRR